MSEKTHWAEVINRVLRREIEFAQMIADAVGSVLSAESRPPHFGPILRATFETAVADPSLEHFDEASEGRFAAHVVLAWLHEWPAAKRGDREKCAELAQRHISRCFADRSERFKDALTGELAALATGS